jgi:hypothetical protein
VLASVFPVDKPFALPLVFPGAFPTDTHGADNPSRLIGGGAVWLG